MHLPLRAKRRSDSSRQEKKARRDQTAGLQCLPRAIRREAISVGMEESISTKPRKRLGAKAPQRTSSEKLKVSIVLSADVDFKLSVASAALRMDRSALVNQILAESPTLRRFVVQDRAKPAGEATAGISA